LLDSLGEIADPQTISIRTNGAPLTSGNGATLWVYTGHIPCRTSGQYGFCVRVLPKNLLLPHLFETGLVTWG
jgi:starch phosphorylase